MSRNVELVADRRATLGEGAFWDPRNSVLNWVDIEGRAIHTYDPSSKRDTMFSLPDRPCSVVPRQGGGLAVALGRSVVLLEDGGRTPLTHCEFTEEAEASRMNDGKCDPRGRLWVGSISMEGDEKTSALYCVETDGSYRVVLTEVTISNGIVWTADEKTMYYVDTPTHKVDAFDYDSASGAISNRRTVVVIPHTMGYPDGMTIDSEGMLWVAMFGGSTVRRFDPARGKLLDTVQLPVSQVTSCALGGDDLTDLYVTTARIQLSVQGLAAQPVAGGLFRTGVTVPGVPQHLFAG